MSEATADELRELLKSATPDKGGRTFIGAQRPHRVAAAIIELLAARDKIDLYEHACAAAYQKFGAFADEHDAFETDHSEELLDLLSQPLEKAVALRQELAAIEAEQETA